MQNKKLPEVVFTSIDEITTHDWVGNAYHDMPAFVAVRRFVSDENNSVVDRAEAIRSMSERAMGCGRVEHMTNRELIADFIAHG